MYSHPRIIINIFFTKQKFGMLRQIQYVLMIYDRNCHSIPFPLLQIHFTLSYSCTAAAFSYAITRNSWACLYFWGALTRLLHLFLFENGPCY